MTAREITECVKRINNRKMQEYRFNAQIHGATMKEESKKIDEPLSEKEKAFADQRMKKLIEEKQKEIARRNKRKFGNGK